MAELNSAPAKAGGKSKRTRIPVRVDLTAMVDLAFLLITFFMLTTTLQKQEAMAIAMPDKTNDVINDSFTPANRTMTICLGKNNQVLWYMGMADAPLSNPEIVNYGKNSLREAILNKRNQIKAQTGKDLIVLVKPSTHSIYDNLVSTLDELNISKVDRYAIVDISPKDVDLLKKYKAY
ncbi:ExbD/TolR family protein [Mucilaginibacter jinjuensis]|uniref:Biopolymer transporter ExbD n=1 Tax=Mucilaginibacter jinjuensis TaxID=1176721 RepID=A0ABY7TCL3_9SPHI|nr:biopolymer transporter ExbD [Mucilaginibacter jinjuensis]WCT13948.1 biopolymer transporter ExbD [Mucilaginibacter jinjuensis]